MISKSQKAPNLSAFVFDIKLHCSEREICRKVETVKNISQNRITMEVDMRKRWTKKVLKQADFCRC